jgi:iron complex outermembrane receptor protein
VFAVQELTLQSFAVQLGARWESVDIETDDAILPDRSFDGFSASAGFKWNLVGSWAIGSTISRTTRLPTSEELYGDGPHLSTFQYEVGNPDLVKEQGSALELSVSRTEGRVTGEVTLFAADYDDYIFLVPTGNTVQVGGEEVPQFVTLQRDARYRGGEARIRIDLHHSAAHHVRLELRGDTVRGETDRMATGQWLPKIPASRAAVGIRYDGSRVWGGLEVVRVSEQDRVQLFEAPTEGYTMFNAHAGFRIHSQQVVHDILVVATNLTDELARNHISPLKEIAPLRGQDISVSYKVQF